MKIRFLFTIFFIILSLFLPARLFAATFGITPSVLETQVERGDKLYGFVSLVRANPKEDTYIRVSIRGDETGAIELTSGNRFLLPQGEYDVRYTFAVETSKLEGIERFEAGLEFINEIPEVGNGGTSHILGNVMKIDVTILDAQSDVAQMTNTTDTVPSDGADIDSQKEQKFSVSQKDVLFMAFAGVLLYVGVEIWRRYRKDARARAKFFLLTAFLFLISVFGWAYLSGRTLIHRWENVWSMSTSLLTDGAYFLVTSPDDPDTFLSPLTGQSQEMDGDWTYFTTAPDRVYVTPTNVMTDDSYENRLFLFYEGGIKPYGSSDLPGTVSFVRENIIGTYAVFKGLLSQQSGTYWCLTEVWETSEILCDFLDRRIKDEIQEVWFSPEEPHIALIQTTQAVYQFDVWRKTLEILPESPKQEEKPSENARPLEASGKKSWFGVIQLDQKWMLTRLGAQYYPLSSSLWIERVSIDTQTDKISLVDSRTFKRILVTELSTDETLIYLQKGGLITSP